MSDGVNGDGEKTTGGDDACFDVGGTVRAGSGLEEGRGIQIRAVVERMVGIEGISAVHEGVDVVGPGRMRLL